MNKFLEKILSRMHGVFVGRYSTAFLSDGFGFSTAFLSDGFGHVVPSFSGRGSSPKFDHGGLFSGGSDEQISEVGLFSGASDAVQISGEGAVDGGVAAWSTVASAADEDSESSSFLDTVRLRGFLAATILRRF